MPFFVLPRPKHISRSIPPFTTCTCSPPCLQLHLLLESQPAILATPWFIRWQATFDSLWALLPGPLPVRIFLEPSWNRSQVSRFDMFLHWGWEGQNSLPDTFVGADGHTVVENFSVSLLERPLHASHLTYNTNLLVTYSYVEKCMKWQTYCCCDT